jgi:alkanesulfonate monooxygenase SsuD/methylene tetrahydromethanopterin reductase-like flavin-dependent oxidoreductase (luciferase family)
MGSLPPPDKKKVHLNLFETACRSGHECAGQWARPGDNVSAKDTLDYYVNMAKLAEKAKVTGIFFADAYAAHDTYEGKVDAVFRAGIQVAQLDPMVIISAMAVSREKLFSTDAILRERR